MRLYLVFPKIWFFVSNRVLAYSWESSRTFTCRFFYQIIFAHLPSYGSSRAMTLSRPSRQSVLEPATPEFGNRLVSWTGGCQVTYVFCSIHLTYHGLQSCSSEIVELKSFSGLLKHKLIVIRSYLCLGALSSVFLEAAREQQSFLRSAF